MAKCPLCGGSPMIGSPGTEPDGVTYCKCHPHAYWAEIGRLKAQYQTAFDGEDKYLQECRRLRTLLREGTRLLRTCTVQHPGGAVAEHIAAAEKEMVKKSGRIPW